MDKVKIICPKHGEFLQKANSHLVGYGCLNCNESKGECAIANYLDGRNIKYIRQYKFDGCKNKYRLRFDFYLIDFNWCIEFDGMQHFSKESKYARENFSYIQLLDKIKTDFCFSKNITLIRVSYLDCINEILDGYINKIIEP